MVKYELNGQVYEFDDTITDEDALRLMEQDQAALKEEPEKEVPLGGVSVMNELDVPPPPQPEPLPEEVVVPTNRTGDLTEEDLYADPEMAKDAKHMYEVENGTPFEGTDEEAVNWALWQMSDLNNNTWSMAQDLARLDWTPQSYKESLSRVIDKYDRSNTTLNTVGRGLVSGITDPLTVAGVAAGVFTGGGSAVATQGVKQGAKAALLSYLKRHVGGAAFAAVEGGAVIGLQDHLKQRVEMGVRPEQEYDPSRLATNIGMGAGAGGVIGLVGPGIVQGVVKGVDGILGKGAAKEAEKAAEQAVPAKNDGSKAPVQAPQPAPAPQKVVVDPARVTDVELDTKVPPTRTTTEVPEITVRPPEAPTGAIPEPVGPARTITDEEIRLALDAANDPKKMEEFTRTLGTSPTVRKTIDDINEAVQRFARDGSFGNIPSSRAELEQMIKPVTDILTRVTSQQDGMQINMELLTRSMTDDQRSAIKGAVQNAAERLAQLRGELLKRASAGDATARQLEEAIGSTQRQIAELDTYLSSGSGRDLGSRVGGLMTNQNRNLSVERFLEDKGITPELATKAQRADAEVQFLKALDNHYRKAEANVEVRRLGVEMNKAYQKGDILSAVRLQKEREAALKMLVSNSSGVELGKINQMWARVSGYAISNVFSVRTLVVNMSMASIKMATSPAQRFLSKGFSRAAYREMMATYGEMVSAIQGSIGYGRAAFRYEKGLVGEDTFKVYGEQGDDLWGGNIGAFLRFFPRAIAAQDTAMANIIYRGRIAGQAAHDATVKGMELKLKGKKLREYVDQQVQFMLDNAFEKELNLDEIVPMLRQRGIARGKTGDALDAFIVAEIQRNGQYLKQATNQTALDFVDDALWRRAGSTSGGAVDKGLYAMEYMLRKQPWTRFFFQLFLRTPVRVFQEGLRMTPGLNMINPAMMADLLGKNGEEAYVKATAQLQVSFAVTGAIMLGFGTGSITGGGPRDPKQKAALERTGWKPYSFWNGKGWTSYRTLDPLSTPIKILANVWEGSQELAYRQSQGERVDETYMQNLQAYTSVGATAIFFALKDSGLLEGASQAADLLSGILDPETRGQEIDKFFSSKVGTLIPFGATSFNIQQAIDPNVHDNRTFEQALRARIQPSNQYSPRRYDLLGGEAVSNISTLGYLTGIDWGVKKKLSPEEQKRQDVLTALSNLELAADTNFQLPYKNPKFGTDDLRLTYTADGEQTLYDRWQSKIAEYDQWAIDKLHEVLVEDMRSPMPTASTDTAVVEQARYILDQIRDAAWAELMQEEQELVVGYQKKLFKEQRDKIGNNNSVFAPPINR